MWMQKWRSSLKKIRKTQRFSLFKPGEGHSITSHTLPIIKSSAFNAFLIQFQHKMMCYEPVNRHFDEVCVIENVVSHSHEIQTWIQISCPPPCSQGHPSVTIMYYRLIWNQWHKTASSGKWPNDSWSILLLVEPGPGDTMLQMVAWWSQKQLKNACRHMKRRTQRKRRRRLMKCLAKSHGTSCLPS